MSKYERPLSAYQKKLVALARLNAFAVEVRFSAGAVGVLAAKRGVVHGLEGFAVIWADGEGPSAMSRYHGWPKGVDGYTAICAELRRLITPLS